MADSSFPSRRSSVASRRSLQRRSSRLSYNDNLIDIFSDDNATADFMPVADGFRPSSAAIQPLPSGSSSPPRPSSPQLPPRAVSPPRASEYLKKRIAGQERPSSIHRSSLSGPQRESFMQRIPSVSASASSETTPRPLSTASGLSAASESSYIPSAGPSHAYASYPQVSGLNRHASTSTVQTQNRPYNGPSRPTHPYAMYPQIPGSQDPEEGDPFADPGDIANVGFPGLGQTYARVRGADGEDADDLIGPDGHTEQLPPYSRFPSDLPPKARNELADVSAPLLPIQASLLSSHLEEPLTDPSSTTSLLDNDEGTLINTAAARAAGDDDRSRAQRIKDTGQKKIWGRVPVWAWISIVIILCIIAASLGAALGSLAAKHSNRLPPGDADDSASNTSTSSGQSVYPSITNSDRPPHYAHGPTTIWQTVTTTLIDAAPLTSTPSSLPPLPPGASYGIPLAQADLNWNKCVDQSNNMTWQCSPHSFLNVSVTKDENCDLPSVQLTAEYHKDAPLRYGAQAPTMNGPAQVSLMADIQDNNHGPAYFFQQLVDKLVIIKHDEVPVEFLQKLKESIFTGQVAQNEWMHGRDDDDAADDVGPSSHPDVDSFLDERESLPLGASYNTFQARGQGPPPPVLTGDILWYCFWNRTILEGFIYMTEPNSNAPHEASAIASDAASALYSDHGWTAAASSTASPVTKRGSSPASPTSGQQNTSPPMVTPSSLPYNFKIEERRGSPDMPTPYCQKMFANSTGQIVPMKDGPGPNLFNITEKHLVPQSNVANGNSRRFSRRQQGVNNDGTNGSNDNSCKCIWTCV